MILQAWLNFRGQNTDPKILGAFLPMLVDPPWFFRYKFENHSFSSTFEALL